MKLTHMFLRRCLSLAGLVLLLSCLSSATVHAEDNEIMKIGIIGLDTSHAPAFTKAMNREPADPEMLGCRVVAAYPYGSRKIESSSSRIPKYVKEFEEMGIEIVDSLDALLERVDGVLLETNDGGPHLEQALAVFRAGKPVFIDKPAAAQLPDVVAIYQAAEKYQVPMFSSSSLRYAANAQAIRAGKYGKVLGCDAYSPCSLEPSHADLFWYGIHGVELLYTVMGTGCQQVTRTSSDDFELVVGKWEDGRIGTFRGIRAGSGGYGGTAFGETGKGEIGPYDGYRPLVVEIAKFFRSGQSPIAAAETLELYTFMAAADASKQAGGKPVDLANVREHAEQQAAIRLKQFEQ